MEKVSIIMSVYNEKEEWLKQSIESILNQTYLNIEFIIVLDDPKNVDLENLILSYVNKDKRVLFIKNERNKGLVFSLNQAIKYATGEYIARMDADDISLSTRIEKELEFLKNNQYDIVGCFIKCFMNKEKKFEKKYPEKNDDIYNALNFYCPIAHPTYLVRREVYIKLNGYSSFSCCEDYDFLLRAKCFQYKMGNLNKYLLYYRINFNSISHLNTYKQALGTKFLSQNSKNILNVDINDLEIFLKNNRLTERSLINYSKANIYYKKYKLENNYILKYIWLIRSMLISKHYFKINYYKDIKNIFGG